jgi:hypothetical protein
MNTKPFAIILAVSLGLMVLGSIAGGVLQSKMKLTMEQLGSTWALSIKLTYLVLFFVMGFSLVPLALHYFITMQGRIGHADLTLVRWLAAHETQVVYAIWGFFAVGLAFALPAAMKGGFLK